jgi:hypothetical protein
MNSYAPPLAAVRTVTPQDEVWSALAIVAKAGIPIFMEGFVQELNTRYGIVAAASFKSLADWVNNQPVSFLLGHKVGGHYNRALDTLYRLSTETLGKNVDELSFGLLQETLKDTLVRFHIEDPKSEDPILLVPAAVDGEFLLRRYTEHNRIVNDARRARNP